MKKFNLCIIAIVFLMIVPKEVLAADYLEDGEQHIIDSVYESANIYLDYNVSNTPGTHLELAEGGRVTGSIVAYNTSSVQISGGSVPFLQGTDNSTISMIDGEIGGILRAWGNSTVNFSGGSIGDRLWIKDQSFVTMNGGTVLNDVYVQMDSKAYISNGSIEEIYTTQNGQLSLSGGSVRYLWTEDNSSITITGGLITDDLYVSDDSTVSMAGGEIADILYVRNNGILYLEGSDFQVVDDYGLTTELSPGDTFKSVLELNEYGSYSGTLTGTLSDGSLMDNYFVIYETGLYGGDCDIVIIPEPATLSLLALGAFLAGRRKRK